MRRCLAVLMVAILSVLPGCGGGPSDAECRSEFGAIAQSLAENGNPGTAVTPITTRRWDRISDELADRARTAAGDDCPGDLDQLRRSLRGTQTILFAAHDHDMAAALARAEHDLEHAERMQTYDRFPARLTSAFEALRVAAPRAATSVGPQMATLDRLDPLDRDAIGSATRALATAARADPDYQHCRRLLDVIDGYTLDEE